MGLTDRIQHAVSAFVMNRDPTSYVSVGAGTYFRPDRITQFKGTDRAIITSICNRIALDVSALAFEHVQLDTEMRFESIESTKLNNCLTVEANKDQTGRELIFDITMSMLDEGYVALVPTETLGDPFLSNKYDILSMRVAKILQWYPDNVKVRVYNEQTGLKEEKILPKRIIAVLENPFYAVMNEPNSTAQRLTRKLSLIDRIDEKSSSGKLDLIIQLPFALKTPMKIAQADERLEAIERQLSSSSHGIAYIDATEKITQLNRPVENNLLQQVEYYTNLLFSQLGMTQGILDGTATPLTMRNYQNRIVEPIAATIANGIIRTFLTKTARTQRKTIRYFMDPFKMLTGSEIIEMSESLTRNEILSSNEVRQILGRKPSNDPNADKLKNKNLNSPVEQNQTQTQ